VDIWWETIDWFATVDGKEIPLGRSGPHTIYATFSVPHGRMHWNPQAFPDQTGPDQDVTEERLKLAVSYARLAPTEKEVVDAVFKRLTSIQRYVLQKTWPWVAPGTSFHQYLWQLTNGPPVEGECHMLAAAFVMACEMLGVTKMELGRMCPAGRRDPVSGEPRADAKRGYYERLETRDHTLKHSWPSKDEPHGEECLAFLDSRGGTNNFEGVARYSDRYLYGIGEAVPQTGDTADENAHLWYQSADFRLFFCARRHGKRMSRCVPR
jgi:hypothetical protein